MMKKLLLSEHHGRRAFMDLSGRHKPKLHGGAFRMGDRAAAYVWLLDWRTRNPHDHIIVVDDPNREEVSWAKHLDIEWMFRGIADELWIAESSTEEIPKPAAYVMYHTNMWRIWLWLRKNKICRPSIQPKPENCTKVRALLDKHKLYSGFITIQPLYDAAYNQHRNAPPGWWAELCEEIGKICPVVLIGTKDSAAKMRTPKNCYPLWNEDLDPMDSLALISMAAVHVGGETGTTLWAPILNIPTAAVYIHWGDTGGHFPMDCRPMQFEKPVRHIPLNGSSATGAAVVKRLL
jgi:hypothetical protein